MSRIKKDVYQYLLPNLLEVQRTSYCWFLEKGLVQELSNFSAIQDYVGELELSFSSKFYRIKMPKYTLEEAKRRDTTYSVRLYSVATLKSLDHPKFTSDEVFLGDIPLMTNEGTFLVNGIERVIINKIVSSPGIYYKTESDKQNIRHYTASLISNRGNWVKFEIDKEDSMYVKVDKAKKLSAYIFLLAIGLTRTEILEGLDHPEFFQKILEGYETTTLEEAFLEVHNKLSPG